MIEMSKQHDFINCVQDHGALLALDDELETFDFSCEICKINGIITFESGVRMIREAQN